MKYRYIPQYKINPNMKVWRNIYSYNLKVIREVEANTWMTVLEKFAPFSRDEDGGNFGGGI
jgi:hypothetical protein